MNIKSFSHNSNPAIQKPVAKTASKQVSTPKDGFQKSQPDEKLDSDRMKGLKGFFTNTPDVNAGGLFGGVAIMVAGLTAANAIGGSSMIPLILTSIVAGTAVLFSGR